MNVWTEYHYLKYIRIKKRLVYKAVFKSAQTLFVQSPSVFSHVKHSDSAFVLDDIIDSNVLMTCL